MNNKDNIKTILSKNLVNHSFSMNLDKKAISVQYVYKSDYEMENPLNGKVTDYGSEKIVKKLKEKSSDKLSVIIGLYC